VLKKDEKANFGACALYVLAGPVLHGAAVTGIAITSVTTVLSKQV
jgi:hypothetical protein